MQADLDVIQHLIQVESDAEELVKEAKKSADLKIQEAKSSAEKSFNEKYVQAVKTVLDEEENSKQKITAEQNEIFNKYCKNLYSAPKDLDSFNKLLDERLFKNQVRS